MRTLKFQIIDPTGEAVEDKTQIIEFSAGEANSLLITIGDYTYHMNRDGSLIAGVNKLFTPYD
jgi:hypothetical protein